MRMGYHVDGAVSDPAGRPAPERAPEIDPRPRTFPILVATSAVRYMTAMRLVPATSWEGPALFEERESTCVISVGDVASRR